MKRRTNFAIVSMLVGVFLITLPAWKQIDEVQATLVQAEPEPEIQVVEVIKYVPEYHYTRIEPPFEYENLGQFKTTFYTAGYESTGKTPEHPAYGITKSGARVEQGVTIAVDPRIIELGSYVYIEGLAKYIEEMTGLKTTDFRVAQDTGGDIEEYWIDVYIEDVSLAKQLGVEYFFVYSIK